MLHGDLFDIPLGFAWSKNDIANKMKHTCMHRDGPYDYEMNYYGKTFIDIYQLAT